jgi:hypothetical protein
VIKDSETPIARLVPFEKSRLGSKPSAADVAQGNGQAEVLQTQGAEAGRSGKSVP